MTHLSPATLKATRHKLKLTQRQFAALLGIHPMTVSKAECGAHDLPPYTVRQIVCVRRGLRDMTAPDFDEIAALVERDKYVEALACVVVRGMP